MLLILYQFCRNQTYPDAFAKRWEVHFLGNNLFNTKKFNF